MRMQRTCAVKLGWASLAVTVLAGACAQAPQYEAEKSSLQPTPIASSTAAPDPSEVVREIADPATGTLWLLTRDPDHPAGPGRITRVRLSAVPSDGERSRGAGPVSAADSEKRPLIHAGDTLLVEEHSALVDARLEARALGPAAKGANFRARLKMGGAVVRAVAVAPGHAALAPEDEGKP